MGNILFLNLMRNVLNKCLRENLDRFLHYVVMIKVQLRELLSEIPYVLLWKTLWAPNCHIM